MRNLLQTRINWRLFKHNIKANKAYLILFTILFFVAYPSYYILLLLRGANLSRQYSSAPAPYVLLVLTFFASFFIPFVIHTYLNSKKAVDVFHSLPIKRRDLYMTNALTAAVIVLLPYAINYALGHSLLFLNKVPLTGYPVFHYFIATCVLFTAIQVCTNFVIINTGALANGLIHAGLLVVAPFVVFAAISLFVERFVFGLSFFDELILLYLSPIYAVFRLLEPNISLLRVVTTSVYWFIVTLLFTVFILNIYNKRKSERTEEPFTSLRYFPIVASIFTGFLLLVLLSLFGINYYSSNGGMADFLTLDTLLIPLGLTFVVYVILDFFRFKSVKNFLKSTSHFAIIAATTITLSVIMIITGFFGFAYYTPAASTVNEVSIAVPTRAFPFSGGNTYTTHNFTLNQAESVVDILSFQRVISDFYRENPSFNYFSETILMDGESVSINPSETSAISITYKLKLGVTINRSYDLPEPVTHELYVLMNNFDVQKTLNPILDSTLQLSSTSVTVYNGNMTQKTSLLMNNVLRTEFINTYRQELKSMTDQVAAFEESDLKYIINYELAIDSTRNTSYFSTYDLFIDSRFPKTLALLEENMTTQQPTAFTHTLTKIDNSLIVGPNAGMPASQLSEYDLEALNKIMPKVLSSAEIQALRVLGPHISSTSYQVMIVEADKTTYILPVGLD